MGGSDAQGHDRDAAAQDPLTLDARYSLMTVRVGLSCSLVAGAVGLALLRAGGPVPELTALAGAAGAALLVLKLLETRAPTLHIDRDGLVLRNGRRQRRILRADIADVECVRHYLDPAPLSANPKLTLQDGIKLSLQDGTAAFIPDCFDIPQTDILAATVRLRQPR